MTFLSPTVGLLTIRVASLRLRAYIGYLDWEKEKLQDVVISYALKYNGAMATAYDDVHHAVNYKDLTKQLIALVDNQAFHLIETLAEQVYTHIFGFDQAIEEVEVTVEKPHALRFADNVMIHISSKERYNTVLIGLGSNMDPEAHIDRALSCLDRLGQVLQRTDLVYTAPLKYEAQDRFLNGAVLLRSTMSRSGLERELKYIEAQMGRVRLENKNGPRVIDLDIIAFNGVLLDPADLEELPFLTEFVKQLQPEALSIP